MLWGTITALFFAKLSHEPGAFGTTTNALFIGQAACCALGGFLALVRQRGLACAVLWLASFLLLALINLAIWYSLQHREMLQNNMILCVALLFIGVGYAFLGRWLGMQEDSDD